MSTSPRLNLATHLSVSSLSPSDARTWCSQLLTSAACCAYPVYPATSFLTPALRVSCGSRFFYSSCGFPVGHDTTAVTGHVFLQKLRVFCASRFFTLGLGSFHPRSGFLRGHVYRTGAATVVVVAISPSSETNPENKRPTKWTKSDANRHHQESTRGVTASTHGTLVVPALLLRDHRELRRSTAPREPSHATLDGVHRTHEH